MTIETKELLTSSAGLGIAGAVGLGCSKGVKWGYDSLISHIRGVDPTIAKVAVESRILSGSFEYKIPESILSGVQKVLKISGLAAQKGAFGAGMIETFWNFQKTWQSKKSPSILRNTLEGGLRGSLLGLAAGGIFTQETGYYKLMQVVSGASAGCLVGMFGACVGTVAGLGFKKEESK